MPSEANDVGYDGEKNKSSWPATSEVRSQSSRTVAVLTRRAPELDPFMVSGNSPKKSATKSPRVLAPASRGPCTSSPSWDRRTVSPKLPPALLPIKDGLVGRATPGTSE